MSECLGFRRESGWHGCVWWAGSGEEVGQANDDGERHYKRPAFFLLSVAEQKAGTEKARFVLFSSSHSKCDADITEW